MSRLEGKVNLLLKNAGLHYDPYADLPPTVIEALRKKEKIQAIKHYRQATGNRPEGGEGIHRKDMRRSWAGG